MDYAHKQYIDGKLHEVKECPECKSWGEVQCTCGCGNEHETSCDCCEGLGYIKK